MLVPLGFVGPTGCCSQFLNSDCAREAKTAMASFLSERLRLQSCNASSSCPRLNSHCLSVQFCFLFRLSCLNEPCFLQRLAPRQIVDESVLFVVLNWRFNSPLLQKKGSIWLVRRLREAKFNWWEKITNDRMGQKRITSMSLVANWNNQWSLSSSPQQ